MYVVCIHAFVFFLFFMCLFVVTKKFCCLFPWIVCETREKHIIIIIFFLKMSESVILVGMVQTKP